MRAKGWVILEPKVAVFLGDFLLEEEGLEGFFVVRRGFCNAAILPLPVEFLDVP